MSVKSNKSSNFEASNNTNYNSRNYNYKYIKLT